MSFSSTRTNAQILPFGLSKSRLLTSALAQAEDRSTAEQASDEALMAMLRDGLQDAIGSLFRRHARAIHTVGKRILQDPTEAEDLVQEVFLLCVWLDAALYEGKDRLADPRLAIFLMRCGKPGRLNRTGRLSADQDDEICVPHAFHAGDPRRVRLRSKSSAISGWWLRVVTAVRAA